MHVGVVAVAIIGSVVAVVGGTVFFASAVIVVIVVGDVTVGLIITVVVVVADVKAVDNFRRGCETCLTSHALNKRDYVRRMRMRRMRIMMGRRCVDIVVMSVYNSRLRKRGYNSSVVCHRTHIREGSMMM